MPHADDQLKTFPVAHPVLVRDLSVIVEKRDIILCGAGERFQALHSAGELSNRFSMHPSSIEPCRRIWNDRPAGGCLVPAPRRSSLSLVQRRNAQGPEEPNLNLWTSKRKEQERGSL